MCRFAAAAIAVSLLSACAADGPAAPVAAEKTDVAAAPSPIPTAASTPEPTSFKMPDVSGVPYSDARAELRDLGADVRRQIVASNDDRYLVVGQSVQPGVLVADGATLTLRISSGHKQPAKKRRAPVAVPPTQITAVPDLPPGLFCRDLNARGYSYAEAVWYWDLEGRPARMDVGNDGIPCTTVFPPEEVAAYQGGRTPLYDLPSGLFCRDLYHAGYSYPEAVWYWTREGRPARMDVGNDGIPCTTVYPDADVEAYWQ